ncbi:hypothetical protein CPB84DRAFT_166987 [Gymnopilus junonius]|uniref:Uncharacterized protein n=1 Tax=Gymnopilus junonius TaxID=109634 RepID=A0A9P5NU07_GYMJU|nr:hypothetical protein CPB84DRAFT_166987 [Gymnopilus junonius]
MEHQFRRGIYRPNAQRLSISLAPLVAQRSLLFRVKADLATKTNYEELTPTEESPGLFLLSGNVTPSPSARIISAALSALSTASVYSQDSWDGEKSPFGAILVPPQPQPHSQQYLNVRPDTRRHAIALSPGVQWEDLLEEDESHIGVPDVALNTPLPQSPTPPEHGNPAPDHNAIEASLPLESGVEVFPMSKAVVDIPVIKLEVLGGGPAAGKLQKKKRSPSEDMNDTTTKRVSKHAKAFGKVIGHLSLQPSSRKEIAAPKQRRNTTPVVSVNKASPDYKLPELKPGMASPIRMSFIANSGSGPLIVPGLHEPAPIPHQAHYVKASQTRQTLSANPKPQPRTAKIRQTMPPATPLPRRSSTPPPPTPVPTAGKKGHRRYKSSPAAAQFDFDTKTKDWEREDVPPLPAMPPFATLNLSVPRQRAGSLATLPPSVPIVRGIEPPFPVYAVHQPRQRLVM